MPVAQQEEIGGASRLRGKDGGSEGEGAYGGRRGEGEGVAAVACSGDKEYMALRVQNGVLIGWEPGDRFFAIG
jgi:hypothetical protein